MNNFYEPGTPLYYGGNTIPNQSTAPSINTSDNIYMEDVLKKIEPIKATFYMTFSGSNEWRDKVFTGILEAAGRDHVVLSDPTTGKWYILPNIYVDYIEFDEDIKKYIQNN